MTCDDIRKISKGDTRCIVKRSTSRDHAPSRISEETLMKRKLFITLSIVAMVCIASPFFTAAAHPGGHEKNAFTPDTIPWGPPPPFVAPGAQLAAIEGNPAASTGDYTVRLKMPDGYRIAPHWHPLRENVTVI